MSGALSLPIDNDGDGLADHWELDVVKAPSLATLDATSDNDIINTNLPGDKADPGDGLSVMEEYRGFFVRGRHVRTDQANDETPGSKSVFGGPFRRDMFVIDPDKLFTRYGELLAKYGTAVHVIEEGEFFQTTDPFEGLRNGQINAFTDPAFLVVPGAGVIHGQWAIPLKDTSVNTTATGRDVYGRSDIFYSKVGDVEINANRLEADCKIRGLEPKSVRAHLRALIAHEVGHRLTLRHPLRLMSTPLTVLTTDGDPLPDGVNAAILHDGRGVRFRGLGEKAGHVGPDLCEYPLDLFLVRSEAEIVPPGRPFDEKSMDVREQSMFQPVFKPGGVELVGSFHELIADFLFIPGKELSSDELRSLRQAGGHRAFLRVKVALTVGDRAQANISGDADWMNSFFLFLLPADSIQRERLDRLRMWRKRAPLLEEE